MAIEDLLADEDPSVLMRQARPGQVDLQGLPLHGLQDVCSVQGRPVLASARQVSAWHALDIEADYEFVTLEDDVRNGDFIRLSDDRLFRMTGVGQKRYGKGSIQTYYKYPLVESSLGRGRDRAT